MNPTGSNPTPIAGTGPTRPAGVSRRGMLRGTTAAAGAATFAALGTNFAWSQVSEELKVGIVGAGGRGKGAAGNIVEASKDAGVKVKVHAVADVFPFEAKDKKDFIERNKIDKKNQYVGLDGYKELVNSDVELVILATPPGFRPIHFEAAIQSGKHVFFEKPVATDPWGVRKVMEAGKLATEKKLGVVAGTQRRHETNYIDTIKQIHEGAIGDVLHMSVYWCGGGIWWRKREAWMTDMEYQVHNWYHHIWLSGDQICEQHIHNLDVANWVMNSHPISAFGMGGRQVRKEPGEIWDHTAVEYEYPNGGRVLSYGRHWPNSDSPVSEFAIGSKGTSNPGGWIQPKGGQRQNFKNTKSGYVQEHIDLLKSIKAGTPLNETQQVAESTLTAIMGRMSCYTGKKVSWDFAMNSKLRLIPENLSKDAAPPPVEIPEPGKTKLI
ncbi:MAG TPA: Gfo/Idh/MocA family oxidoreductase [Tepidisphaeraceae bacterium]|nr:Gfo/Idh/MocA family oxidoreductase [Tepidisphaeraceae bacterium]